jgi:hypothetical protein
VITLIKHELGAPKPPTQPLIEYLPLKMNVGGVVSSPRNHIMIGERKKAGGVQMKAGKNTTRSRGRVIGQSWQPKMTLLGRGPESGELKIQRRTQDKGFQQGLKTKKDGWFN